jgi:hypothetical protein
VPLGSWEDGRKRLCHGAVGVTQSPNSAALIAYDWAWLEDDYHTVGWQIPELEWSLEPGRVSRVLIGQGRGGRG